MPHARLPQVALSLGRVCGECPDTTRLHYQRAEETWTQDSASAACAAPSWTHNWNTEKTAAPPKLRGDTAFVHAVVCGLKFADAVIRARTDTATMPDSSPVRSSGSNGVGERVIKEVQGQLRAMKSVLDAMAGVDIRSTSNILPWMVEYAPVLINRCIVGKDGRTAHERLRGRKSKMLGFEFGKSFHFRRILFCKAGSKKLDSPTADGALRGIPDAGWRVHGGQQRGSLQDEDDEEDS